MEAAHRFTKTGLLLFTCLLVVAVAQAQLKAVFSVDTIAGCAPFTVRITEQSTGNPTQYLWDFGNGETSSLQKPSLTYTKPGTYILSETVTAGTSQSSTYTTIYVKGVPAGFSYSYSDICKLPATVQFTADSMGSTAKYRWNFGDNNKSIASAPANTYNLGGKYLVQMVTSSAEGCADTTTQLIQVGDKSAGFTLPEVACVGQPVIFTNTSLPIPKTTKWTVANTTITGTNASYTFTTPGTYTVQMEADFGSCSQKTTQTVTVKPSPKSAFTQSGNLVNCSYPVMVAFTNGATNASSYKWLFGDGETSFQTNPTHAFAKAGMFDVSLVAINANGCSDTLTKNALVKLGPPVINGFVNLPTSGCVPVTAKPKANITSAENIVSYDWDMGDGTHEYVAEPTHVYTQPGYYRITLLVKTASGCSASYSMFQAVSGGAFPPAADFSVPDTDVCGAAPVQFTATATGTVTSWTWEFGDGTKSSLQNPVHQYTAPGKYTVTLYVSDKGCPSNTQKKDYLTVKPPFAKAKPVYYCDDRLRVDFEDLSVGALTWNWNFGDGTSSTKQNTTHTYRQSGKYKVTLTTTHDGCTSRIDTLVSVTDSKPKITLSPENGIVCRNNTFSLITDNTDYVSDYLWNMGDGTTLFGDAYVEHAYAANGTYNPFLIVNYLNGCKDTSYLQENIQVWGPTAAFTNPAGSCLKDTVVFTDESKSDGLHAITKWQWNSGDGELYKQTTAPFSHTYNSGGTFTPTLKVTDAMGCSDSAASASPITLKGVTTAFSFEKKSTSCGTASYNFTNESRLSNDAITNYQWRFGDETISSETNPQHTYTQDFNGEIILIANTAGGCSDTAVENIVVAVSSMPEIAITAPDTACVNSTVAFTATQSGKATADGWLWNFGSGETSNQESTTFRYTMPGTYSVQLIASAEAECFDTVTQKILINPLPAVNAGQDAFVCAGATIELTASGAEMYTWQPGSRLSCTDCQTTTASPVTNTQYYVQGKDNNGCENTDSVFITVQQKEQVWVERNTVSICAGDSVILSAAGGDTYRWEPATGLNNPAAANPTARPSETTVYTVSTTDAASCFSTSEQVRVIVNSTPNFNVIDSLLALNRGAIQLLPTTSSADVVSWLWKPQQGLSCYNCAMPYVTADRDITYTATASTEQGCKTSDEISVLILCDKSQLFLPSAFTPNGDGINDRFYPLTTGGGFQKIKFFAVYSSTGQRVFSRQNIYTNTFTDGWDGTYKGTPWNSNVFVYKLEVECDGKIIPFSGTVTVIR